MCEKTGHLVAPRTEFQHTGQQFRGLPATQGLRCVQDQSKLVGVQQALFEGSIWVVLLRMFHNIQDEADAFLDESRDQVVIPDLIPVDAMKAKTALGKHKPGHWLFHLEGFQFEAVEASRPRLMKVEEILVLHGERRSAKTRGHQCENK
jgi:hypothetical protein